MSNGNYREINKFSPTLPAQFSPQTTASATAAATMEWTNEDALELIEQYRSHTELWNRADLKYKDKLCRFRAWSDIADRFGCTKAEVERKMNVLLTQYRREKHKMLMKLYSGIQPGPSKWYAFKRFDFLEGGNNAILAAARHHNRHLHRHLQQQQRRQQASNGLVNASTALNVIDIVAGGAGGGGRGNNSSSNNSRGSSSSFIQSHRKLRNRDMKYFGALGLSLPMLISSSQRLSTWNNAEPFSSPPLPAPTSENDNGRHAATPKIGFSPGTAAQQHHLPPNSMSNTVEELLSGITRNAKSENKSLPANECDDKEEIIEEDNADDSVSIVTESVPSPSPSVAGSEAAPSSSLAAAIKTTEAPAAATTTTSGAIATPSATYSDQISHDELDIKQELGDFFPAPTLAPAPPDSNRSYSSSDEQNRLGGVGDSFDDFAQDLRVSAAAVAAAAKSINFRHFVSPHHQSNINSNNINTNTNSINLTQPFDILRSHPMLQQQHHHQHHHLSTSSSTRQLLMDSLLNESFRSDCSDRANIDEQISQHSNKNNNKNNILNDVKSFSTAAAATSVGPPSVHVPQQAITAAVVTENEQKDDCDYVGSNVTLKLRSMDRTQRIIAEKLISEILFYGQFSELEKTAKIIPK